MGIQINGNTNNINAGIGSLSIEDLNELDIVGVATAANFKTGISNLHSVGLTLTGGQIDVGSNIKIGTAGVITATSFIGSGSGLTGLNSDLVNDTSPQLGGGLASNGFNINFADSSGTNNMAKFGGSGDLQIYHDTAHSRIVDTGTGDLKLQSSKVTIGNAGNTETMATFTENGAAELYHDNIKKFDTITTGIRIHGDEGGTAQLHFLADQGDDNADYWRIIGETSGSILNFQSYNSGNWTNNVRLTGDQGVELYWNNGVKLATSNTGVSVTGTITASSHILLGDGDAVKFGDSTELEIHHNGSSMAHFHNAVGNFIIDTTGNFYVRDSSGSNTAIFANPTGTTQLHHANSLKFETTSVGAQITGSGEHALLLTGTMSSTEGFKYQNNTSGGLCQIGFQQQDTDGLHHRGYIRSYKGSTDGNYGGTIQLVSRGKTLVDGGLVLETGSGGRARFEYHVVPRVTNTHDLGSTSLRWRNVYTNDLNLSNEGSTNSVDNTWGNYTIQEGESDLFLINNRNGKKYKFNLTEVS